MFSVTVHQQTVFWSMFCLQLITWVVSLKSVYFYLMIHVSNYVKQGHGDIVIPPNSGLKAQKLRLPLLLALSVSPLVLLCGSRWHTRDFPRSSLFGVSSKHIVLKIN